MMLTGGAEYVTPSIPGWHEKVSDRSVMSRFEEEASYNPRAYTMALNPLSSIIAFASVFAKRLAQRVS